MAAQPVTASMSSEPSANDKKNFLLTRIATVRNVQAKNLQMYNFGRITIRVSRVVTAIITTIVSTLTALTGLTWIAWLAALGGALLTVIEVIDKEFDPTEMRAHYYNAVFEYDKLTDDINFATILDDDTLKGFMNEFHALQEREMRERPTMKKNPKADQR